MSILGGIGLFAAIANYRKAKQAYNEAKEQEETLLAAVNTYKSNKYSLFQAQYNHAQNSELAGVQVTSICRIGNLVGTLWRAKLTIVLTNTSEFSYEILSVGGVARLFGGMLIMNDQDEQTINSSYILKPGETKEFSLGGSIAKINDENVRDKVRNVICEANGKRLITSCPNTTINGVETANIEFEWRAANGAGSKKRARYANVPGVMRYCGEAYFPK